MSVANTLAARAFLDELARHGVEEVVLAPGSRSTPLVLAAAEDERFRMRVHLDERSVGFFALGYGRATGKPAVVVTTSGTAVANLYPAVIEASMDDVPMIVVSADRPHRLRLHDANQTIDQVGIFANYPRLQEEVPLPELDATTLEQTRKIAGAAAEIAGKHAPGPVHVNFPFDKPLEPVEPPTDFVEANALAVRGRPDGAPTQTSYHLTPVDYYEPREGSLQAIVDALSGPRPVVVLGRTPGGSAAAAALALASEAGVPILADPLSGARFGPSDGAFRVPAYDLFLSDESVVTGLAPTGVVRIGSSVTSAPVLGWLERHPDVPQVVVFPGGRMKDPIGTASLHVQGDLKTVLDGARARLGEPAPPDWTARWRAAGQAALEAVAEQAADHEGSALAFVAEALPSGSSLMVSNSMPIRDFDAFVPPSDRALSAYGNRGASGIDGIVSTAFGIASATDGPTVCVLGDLALFHDQNGLLWSREPDASVVLVLIDNDGGGIFHMLPVAEHEPHFTPYVATPHGMDLSATAALHGIPWWDVEIGEVGRAVLDAIDGGGTGVVRVRTDRDDNVRRHREVRAAVESRVRDVLKTSSEGK